MKGLNQTQLKPKYWRQEKLVKGKDESHLPNRWRVCRAMKHPARILPKMGQKKISLLGFFNKSPPIPDEDDRLIKPILLKKMHLNHLMMRPMMTMTTTM